MLIKLQFLTNSYMYSIFVSTNIHFYVFHSLPTKFSYPRVFNLILPTFNLLINCLLWPWFRACGLFHYWFILSIQYHFAASSSLTSPRSTRSPNVKCSSCWQTLFAIVLVRFQVSFLCRPLALPIWERWPCEIVVLLFVPFYSCSSVSLLFAAFFQLPFSGLHLPRLLIRRHPRLTLYLETCQWRNHHSHRRIQWHRHSKQLVRLLPQGWQLVSLHLYEFLY